ncbi:unnamed protein product, partial [Prorocentrum cordatum]
MSSLAPGTYAFVQYNDPADNGLWHERLILGWVTASEYIVMTPDGDVFIEQLDSANADLSGIRFSPSSGGLPAGLAGVPLYRFAAQPAGAELTALLNEGASHARVERQARGLAQPPGAGMAGGPGGFAPAVVPIPLPVAPPPAAAGAPPPPPPAPRVSPAAGSWVFDVPGPSHAIGQEFLFPAGGLDFGGHAFVSVGGAITAGCFVQADTNLDEWAAERQLFLMQGEPRLLPRRQPAGPVPFTRDAAWLHKDPRVEIHLKGPPTMGDSVTALMARSPGGFMSSHERWLVESKVPAASRSAREHRVVSKALELGQAVDGINLANLTCMEYLNRRRQLLEEAHKTDPDKGNFEGAHHFMGEDDDGAGALAAPSLRSHVAGEFGKEAAIEKPPGFRPPPGLPRPPGCLDDLFPLPLLDPQEADFGGSGRARTGQRRRCIRRDVLSDVNDSLMGLNVLHGCERSSVTAPTEAQRTFVYPAMQVLPMGWSSAFWFVQRLHLEVVRRSGVPSTMVATGSWPLPSVVEGPIEAPCSDNVNVFGLEPGPALATRDRIVAQFEAEGFAMHDISEVSSEGVVLGADVGGPDPFTRRSLKKLLVVRKALFWLATGPYVSGRQLEVILGHYVAACLFCRPGFSIMRAVYEFVRASYDRPKVLWRSCRYECWLMATLCIHLQSPLSLPWASEVIATDASTTGMGVTEARLPKEVEADVGRWRE